MSKMLSRRIFDKCANYVERFVIRFGILRIFKVENVHLHQFISKSLRWRVKYFGQFWNNIYNPCQTMSTMKMYICRGGFILNNKCCKGGFLINANYVERFVIKSGYSEFSRWKMYLCTNLSQNLCDGG